MESMVDDLPSITLPASSSPRGSEEWHIAARHSLSVSVPDITKSLNVHLPLSTRPTRVFQKWSSLVNLHYTYRVNRSTASKIVHKVCKAILNTMKEECLPLPTEEMWLNIADHTVILLHTTVRRINTRVHCSIATHVLPLHVIPGVYIDAVHWQSGARRYLPMSLISSLMCIVPLTNEVPLAPCPADDWLSPINHNVLTFPSPTFSPMLILSMHSTHHCSPLYVHIGHPGIVEGQICIAEIASIIDDGSGLYQMRLLATINDLIEILIPSPWTNLTLSAPENSQENPLKQQNDEQP
ncbi:hypothetical protein PR048_011277 [Dryococelus australis]|uniref:Uncharacterized protein n=1 Tax=Dryococelus australis TaxID=614101 RepID=A0ABQ9HLW1_9NEOP|nr:hypothetical protein PR048_011277 [Dryococelus australis]